MKRWLWLLVGTLVAFSLACGPISQIAELVTGGVEVEELIEGVLDEAITEALPLDEDLPDAPAVDDPVDDDDDALMIDADALDALNSYRVRVSWQLEHTGETVEAWQMEQASTRDPRAQQFEILADGEAMTVVQIGNQTWMRFGDEWIQTTSDDAADIADFGDMLGSDWASGLGSSDREFVGRETVNGVQTRRYRTEYQTGVVGLFGGLDGVDDIAEGTADIWIADQPDLPQFTVKFVLEATGLEDGEPVKLVMTQEVFDINVPFTIEPPADVGGLPEDVPAYPGATDVTMMGGLVMFSTSDAAATVAAFYEDALADVGWQRGDDGTTMEEFVSSVWQKNGQQLSLTITADNDDGSSVMISLEQ